MGSIEEMESTNTALKIEHGDLQFDALQEDVLRFLAKSEYATLADMANTLGVGGDKIYTELTRLESVGYLNVMHILYEEPEYCLTQTGRSYLGTRGRR